MSKHTNTLPCPSCTEKLGQAHRELSDWFNAVVLVQFPNAHISWSYRGKDSQNECVAEGKSKLPWPGSSHNRRVPIDDEKPYDITHEADPNTHPESLALDLFQFTDNGMAVWQPEFFLTLAQQIKDNKEPMLWGGNWPHLGDKDHFQIIIQPS